MANFKYAAVVLGRKEWEECVMDLAMVRSDSLRPVIDAFVENVGRSDCSALTPAQIAWKVRRDQVLADCAMFAATGKLGPDLLEFEKTFEENAKYKEEFESITKKFFSNLTPEQNSQLIFKYGIGYVNILLEGSQAMQRAMEALLASLVLESWTTFETLASDL
ncbi:MAG: hypothetical protein DME34_01280 [Verrucomicrobia bacterium]|nr:MAG: hypothetical protein DME34_01280 [Verrucomicrobiota bacterium]